MSEYHPPVAGPFSSYPPIVPSAGPCYVLGCRQPTGEALAQHRAFGTVRTCADHDPSKDERSAPPGPALDTDGAGWAIDDDDHPNGGTRVPARPTPPTTPPSDGAALTPPAAQAPRLPAGVRAF